MQRRVRLLLEQDLGGLCTWNCAQNPQKERIRHGLTFYNQIAYISRNGQKVAVTLDGSCRAMSGSVGLLDSWETRVGKCRILDAMQCFILSRFLSLSSEKMDKKMLRVEISDTATAKQKSPFHTSPDSYLVPHIYKCT